MADVRLRIWATPTDYLTVDAYFQALPQDNQPFEEVIDQYDLPVLMQFPGQAGKFWVKQLNLTIHSRKRLIRNNSSAATRRNIRQWFEHYVRDGFTDLIFFIQGHGWDADLNEVITKDYYKGHIKRLSPWFRSNLNSASGMPAYLPLTVSPNAEGTFSDFDVVTSVTIRTTRP